MTEKQTTNPRPIETLTAGEHISDNQGVHEIVHVLGLQDGGAREITLTLRPLGPGRPWLLRHPEGTPVWPATPEEVQQYKADSQRQAVADALHKLADDIVQKRLPLPNYTVFFSAGVLESRADLDRWAEYIGAEVKGGTPGDPIPSASCDRLVAGRLSLNFHAQCQPEPQPEPESCPCLDQPEPVGTLPADPEAVETEQEWLFTFGAAQQHDGRFVRIRGTWESARSRMNMVFGHAWCDQYTWRSFDAAGLPARLTELPESEWPAHAEAAAVPTQRAGE